MRQGGGRTGLALPLPLSYPLSFPLSYPFSSPGAFKIQLLGFCGDLQWWPPAVLQAADVPWGFNWALTASFPFFFFFFSFSSICERVTPRLSHANSAVVLSAVKVLMKFMEMLSKDLDYYGTLLKKLAPPLVTLLSAEPELQYVALRNINLIVQKRCVPSFPVLRPSRGAGSLVSVC